jgi:general secretion pathway protein D
LKKIGVSLALSVFLVACAPPTIKELSRSHIQAENIVHSEGAIPQPVQQTVALPKPRASKKTETYSVVVHNIKVDDLLFAIARDANLNIDIHPGISGYVTVNAISQTLQQIFTRISHQVDMRFELEGANLVVMPDTPFLRTYKVDYVNMNRSVTGTVAVTTQVASGTPGAGGTGSASAVGMAGGAAANNSITRIENRSQNLFWETITQNIRDILRETDKILPEGGNEAIGEQQITPVNTVLAVLAQQTPSAASSQTTRRVTFREAASVIAHPESGILTVRATSRQHEKIQEFLSQVIRSAQRQVLIEATVAEVRLSSNYQQGIDWSRLPLGGAGFTLAQRAVGITSPTDSLMELQYNNPNSSGGNFQAAVRLLEGFGTVKVLSSPKLSVMNNQTAVMKVVDNNVYFTLRADTTANTNTTTTTFTTTLQSVPVGFVMNVTPQISENDSVILNIRPSISSIVSYVTDPNPTLANPCGFGVSSCNIPPIVSSVPVVRTREMESVIRIDNGNIAVMGGLIEDRIENLDNAVPVVSNIPVFGELFKQRDDTAAKTELVIFLRPIVIKDASINGDFEHLRDHLPDGDFFRKSPNHPGGLDIFGHLEGKSAP